MMFPPLCTHPSFKMLHLLEDIKGMVQETQISGNEPCFGGKFRMEFYIIFFAAKKSHQ